MRAYPAPPTPSHSVSSASGWGGEGVLMDRGPGPLTLPVTCHPRWLSLQHLNRLIGFLSPTRCSVTAQVPEPIRSGWVGRRNYSSRSGTETTRNGSVRPGVNLPRAGDELPCQGVKAQMNNNRRPSRGSRSRNLR